MHMGLDCDAKSASPLGANHLYEISSMRSVLNIKVILGALTIASILLCATLAYILWIQPVARRPDPSAVASGQVLGPASAALTVIPAPTSTLR